MKDKAEKSALETTTQALFYFSRHREQVILASSLHKEDLWCVIIKATFFFFLGKGVGLLLGLYSCSAGLSFCYRKKTLPNLTTFLATLR